MTPAAITRPCPFCGEAEFLRVMERAMSRPIIDGGDTRKNADGSEALEDVDGVSCDVCEAMAPLDVWNGQRSAAEYAVLRDFDPQPEQARKTGPKAWVSRKEAELFHRLLGRTGYWQTDLAVREWEPGRADLIRELRRGETLSGFLQGARTRAGYVRAITQHFASKRDEIEAEISARLASLEAARAALARIAQVAG